MCFFFIKQQKQSDLIKKMLATRSLRLAVTRYSHPAALSVWSTSVRTLPILQATTTTWYTRPLAVAYSKGVKSGVLFSSSCSFLSPHRHFTTSSVKDTTCTIINPAPNTLESSNSSSPTPLTEKTIKSNESPSTSPSVTNSSSDKPSSSSSVLKSTSPSASSSAGDPKTNTDKSFTDSLGENGVKLPSKEQVESFFFKSLVYLWDFTYYVFCLCRKLVETYVFNNPTVQKYWKEMLKRMDDARKEIKTK